MSGSDAPSSTATAAASESGAAGAGSSDAERHSDAGGGGWYFGFGSNMALVGLSFKNCTPTKSMPGVLRGYTLVHNCVNKHYLVETAFANVVPTSVLDGELKGKGAGPGGAFLGDVLTESEHGVGVHGVLHYLPEASMLTEMDTVELVYTREPLPVYPYDSDGADPVTAWVYVLRSVPPKYASFMDTEMRERAPSERYRNLLVKGAVDAGLDAKYVAFLRGLPATPLPKLQLNDAQRAMLGKREFTAEEVAAEGLTSLLGFVFDVSAMHHPTLRARLRGTDATVAYAKRIADMPEDGKVSPEQLAYIGAVVMEWLHSNYPLLGCTAFVPEVPDTQPMLSSL